MLCSKMCKALSKKDTCHACMHSFLPEKRETPPEHMTDPVDCCRAHVSLDQQIIMPKEDRLVASFMSSARLDSELARPNSIMIQDSCYDPPTPRHDFEMSRYGNAATGRDRPAAFACGNTRWDD
jgi:hypothetical protein